MHVLMFSEGYFGSPTWSARVELRSFDLVETQLGASVDVSVPTAVERDCKVLLTDCYMDETPQMLLNSDKSRLALYYVNAKMVDIITISSSLSLEKSVSLKQVSGFAWSHVPTKFATISKNSVEIHVLLVSRDEV